MNDFSVLQPVCPSIRVQMKQSFEISKVEFSQMGDMSNNSAIGDVA